MVNLYLKSESIEDAVNLTYNICNHLKGNRAFKENDIVVTDPDENGVTCISLGDDYTSHFDISADVVDTVVYETDATYYLSEENSTGIKVYSKKELLDRLSSRIDEILEERGTLDTIEVLLIK